MVEVGRTSDFTSSPYIDEMITPPKFLGRILINNSHENSINGG